MAVSDLPREMVVPEHAQGVRAISFGERRELSYTLDEAFPATAFLEDVDRRWQQADWMPELGSITELDGVSSHVIGWTEVEDATGSHPMARYDWQGGWRDPEGRLMWLALRYESGLDSHQFAGAPPTNTSLGVTIVYLPVHEAQATWAARRSPISNIPIPPHGLPEADGEILSGAFSAMQTGQDGPQHVTVVSNIRFVSRGQEFCESGSSDRCMSRAWLDRQASAGLIQAFVRRNATTDSSTPSAARSGATQDPVLACGRPGYHLGNAFVACLRSVHGKAVAAGVYLFQRNDGILSLTGGARTSPVPRASVVR